VPLLRASLGALKNNRGNAAVEFGLISAALMLLGLAGADYALAMTKAIDLREAARAGVQYAVRQWNDSAGISTVAKSATKQNPNSLTVNSSTFCQCNDGTSTTCGSGTCSDGTERQFVTVTVSMPNQTIISYPGTVIPTTLTGAATLRIH
jgi:Flp pilus assembly protein TadG